VVPRELDVPSLQGTGFLLWIRNVNKERLMATVELYDTTLRDGAQQEGISLSVEDKIKVTLKLDEIGIHYIEGGWPGANPKDNEFFQKAQELRLSHAKLVAFGSTRRAKGKTQEDPVLLSLLQAGTPVITLVGKSWDLHVTKVLETTLEENLEMIADSIRFLKSEGRKVFFDAEHFFDGYKANPEYALRTLTVAESAGADCVILCDTNGGTLPQQVSEVIPMITRHLSTALGIHAHNDADTAVATSLAAVRSGATQVQGTINGYGERCGNANLLSVIADLQLKMGLPCITEDQLARLTEVSRFVSEVVNIPPNNVQPYVGINAFTHKAGLHASAVAKVNLSYEHVPPGVVGNTQQILISEMAGRSNVAFKLRELGLDTQVTREQIPQLIKVIKERENQGFQYEIAEASFELLARRCIPEYKPPFELVDYMVLVEKHRRSESDDIGAGVLAEATVKVRLGSGIAHTAGQGNGPVNALDSALRRALLEEYPELEKVKLLDYRVRVVNQEGGTGAVVRVIIESTDGEEVWHTVGASGNIIEASWMALSDALEFWLARRGLTLDTP
jgi:2-isopropylmalate synthase